MDLWMRYTTFIKGEHFFKLGSYHDIQKNNRLHLVTESIRLEEGIVIALLVDLICPMFQLRFC